MAVLDGHERATRQTDKRPQEPEKPRKTGAFCHGRYWARTSDLRLVEAALSQLS
jgi:hypothetical protein